MSSQQYHTARLLLVEDSDDDAALIERQVRQSFDDFVLTRVDSAESLRQAIHSTQFDCVISDFSMNKFNGIEALEIVQRSGFDIPFILVSGKIGEETAVESMKAGAHDYVLKSCLLRLGPAIKREIGDAKERKRRKEAEQKLLIQERLQVVGELTSSLIHDIRSPLQVILFSAEFLCDRSISEAEANQYFLNVDKQVRRILNQSEDILAYIKGDLHLQMNPVLVNGLLLEFVNTYADALGREKVRLLYKTQPDTDAALTIHADREKLFRMLLNLVNNSRDALPRGGEISISAYAKGSGTTIEVADSGIGIPDEIVDQVFQPFVTHGKSNGTGLGLSFAKQIVEAHGGNISFMTLKDKGTTFYINLPLNPPPLNAPFSVARDNPEPQRA